MECGPYVIDDSCRRSMNAADLQYCARKAPPVGRALRILLGVVLIVYVTPVYFRVPINIVVGSLLLILGLIGVYSLIHIGVSRRIVPFGSLTVKYWEIIADRLSKAGLELGLFYRRLPLRGIGSLHGGTGLSVS